MQHVDVLGRDQGLAFFGLKQFGGELFLLGDELSHLLVFAPDPRVQRPVQHQRLQLQVIAVEILEDARERAVAAVADDADDGVRKALDEPLGLDRDNRRQALDTRHVDQAKALGQDGVIDRDTAPDDLLVVVLVVLLQQIGAELFGVAAADRRAFAALQH